MQLHDLFPNWSAKRDRKRLARGHGGKGHKTAGKGTKGQKVRSGKKVAFWFEGGQTPLVRRLPHQRGFTNARFKERYEPVNVADLARVFAAGATVTPADMVAKRLAANQRIKVLGDGELTVALHVQAPKFSQGAREKILAAGGTVQEV